MFLREEDVREADIRDTVIVHAGSCSLSASPAAEATAKALHLGREMGRLVSFDVNYRDMMWNGSQEACAAKVREILPDVDLLKISEEEADMLGGEAELRPYGAVRIDAGGADPGRSGCQRIFPGGGASLSRVGGPTARMQPAPETPSGAECCLRCDSGVSPRRSS